ncbi:MAG: methylmalonyl-CoA mutase [Phycisphaerales bacterium]
MTTAPSRSTPSAPKVDPHAVTISGIVLDPAYGPPNAGGQTLPESLTHLDRDIASPGAFPFTRGLFPQGYRTRLWTMRQFAGFGSADDTNKRFKYLLAAAKGTSANTGLSTAFDLPTLMGRDSDDELSVGEVGRCGVAIDTIEDMHRLYADIPIDSVTVSQTINGPAAVIWAMYLAMAKQRNISWDTLGGTLQNDILKEFHSQNEFIYPPEASVKLVVDTIEFQSQHVPKWNSVSISGYHIREAGSTAAQELAFTLRDGMEYVEACLMRGLDVDDFAPRLSFFFNSHNEFFEEICKLRAARRIWARMMRDRYNAKNPRSWYMKTHVQTAGCSLTEQQPLNNIVRVAYQAMAAVLGGCQSLHTDSMDETLGLPTEQAVTVALRTQQILAHETGVTRVVDPLGGSWFIEALTDKIEEEALQYIAEIDQMGGGVWKGAESRNGSASAAGASSANPSPLEGEGGRDSGRVRGANGAASGAPSPTSGGRGQGEGSMASSSSSSMSSGSSRFSPLGGYGGVVEGIHRGYFRRHIAEASYRFSEECEAGDRLIVGVNAYREDSSDRPIEILQISHDVETTQVERLKSFKARRDASKVASALEAIRAAARNDDNVMPALVDGALNNCTLGEMVQAMADVYGRYTGGPEW